MNSSTIMYGNESTRVGHPHITISDSVLPFIFELKALLSFNKQFVRDKPNKSFTGMIMTLKRKSLGRLMTGYYYPTTAFALLSMISFLIDPDVVST